MTTTIYTPRQVAEILQLHEFTILKYIRQGKIKAAKMGRIYRVSQAQLDDFLKQQLTHGSI